MDTLRCPSCLSVLPNGRQTRCPTCRARLGTRKRPIVLGEGKRIAAQSRLFLERERQSAPKAGSSSPERKPAAPARAWRRVGRERPPSLFDIESDRVVAAAPPDPEPQVRPVVEPASEVVDAAVSDETRPRTTPTPTDPPRRPPAQWTRYVQAALAAAETASAEPAPAPAPESRRALPPAPVPRLARDRQRRRAESATRRAEPAAPTLFDTAEEDVEGVVATNDAERASAHAPAEASGNERDQRDERDEGAAESQPAAAAPRERRPTARRRSPVGPLLHRSLFDIQRAFDTENGTERVSEPTEATERETPADTVPEPVSEPALSIVPEPEAELVPEPVLEAVPEPEAPQEPVAERPTRALTLVPDPVDASDPEPAGGRPDAPRRWQVAATVIHGGEAALAPVLGETDVDAEEAQRPSVEVAEAAPDVEVAPTPDVEVAPADADDDSVEVDVEDEAEPAVAETVDAAEHADDAERAATVRVVEPEAEVVPVPVPVPTTRRHRIAAVVSLALVVGLALGTVWVRAQDSSPTPAPRARARVSRPPITPAPSRPRVVTPAPILPAGSAGTAGPWKLVLDDGFNGPALDNRRWATCYWWATNGCTNGSSGELSWYQTANVSTTNGALVLDARRQLVNGDGRAYPYTSGMVSGASPDRNLFTFTYGFVEARAWVPAGTGLWSAFWMLPATRQPLPEIDVFETIGEQPDNASAHVHWSSPNGEQQLGQDLATPGLTTGWHTYALDWEPGSLTWYIDGVKRWTVTQPEAVPSTPMYLLADLAVGGVFTQNPTASTPFPSSLKFDYVRVWKHR